MGIENKAVNAIRYLSASMITNAKSGHSGIALGATPILYSLYAKQMNVSPTRANSMFRDRFVMSAGHGSALLYATLHSFGYPISKNDLKNFRKVGNPKVAGHPEVDENIGIDCSTGPLGQGVATAVGMALGEAMLEARFNTQTNNLFDYKTYALVGEGCLMEGVSMEALSLAGQLNLKNLIVIYDRNQVSLDGSTSQTFGYDIKAIMKAYGFNVLEVEDGNDLTELNQKLSLARKSAKPSFVVVNTRIGYKTAYENSNKAHGLVLKDNELEELKRKLKLETKDPFELDKDVQLQFAIAKGRYNIIENSLDEKLKFFKNKYPKDYEKLTKGYAYNSVIFDSLLVENEISSREMGGKILNQLAKYDTRIVGGTADVSSSTKAFIKDGGVVSKGNFAGKNIMYGIREFAMGAISNGLALVGFKPFASTFFVFSDYMKSAIRSSALMQLPVTYILTHDSIAVGEDGPTHQPIEQLAGFRAMPNLNVFRPCSFKECMQAYREAFSSTKTPSVIVLTRQNLKHFEDLSYENIEKGGYIIYPEEKSKTLDGIMVSTGSEIELAVDSAIDLRKKGINVRVVSMLNAKTFDSQSDSYKSSILSSKNIVVVEAGAPEGLAKYATSIDGIVGISTFGESGAKEKLFEKFKITKEQVTEKMKLVIKLNKKEK